MDAVTAPGQVMLANRLIGFFDILGFSQRLKTMEMVDLHSRYAALVDDVRSTVFDPRNLVHPGDVRKNNFARASFLFDSILLISHPLDAPMARGHVWNFIAACITLMEKSFAMQLPLRGCIGRGDYLEDAGRNIFLSPVFPDVVSAEKEQEWSGCFLLPSAAGVALPALFGMTEEGFTGGSERSHPLIRYPVPMKAGEPPERWCLNWAYFMNPSELMEGLRFLRGPKHSHTESFVKYVLALPGEIMHLPEGLRPAVTLRLMMATGGLRLKFCDANDCGVDPPNGFDLQIAVRKTDVVHTQGDERQGVGGEPPR